jgi:hypothetical protein
LAKVCGFFSAMTKGSLRGRASVAEEQFPVLSRINPNRPRKFVSD